MLIYAEDPCLKMNITEVKPAPGSHLVRQKGCQETRLGLSWALTHHVRGAHPCFSPSLNFSICKTRYYFPTA